MRLQGQIDWKVMVDGDSYYYCSGATWDLSWPDAVSFLHASKFLGIFRLGEGEGVHVLLVLGL